MHFGKRFLAGAMAAALSLAAVGCGSGGNNDSATEEKKAVKYDGDFTIGVDNVAEAMGAGWNLGNQLEASSGGKVSETAWGNPEVTQEHLHRDIRKEVIVPVLQDLLREDTRILINTTALNVCLKYLQNKNCIS